MPAFPLHHAHPWDLSPKDAVALQRRLAGAVAARPLPAPPQTIAGVDVSVRGNRVQTAIVVLRVADLAVVDQTVWRGPVVFPYISGLLSFREMPAILPALDQLQVRPDVFMTDSQGQAHPRRMGLACHLGVLLDHPTFGVAKTRLTGVYTEPDVHKGAATPLYASAKNPEVIGQVVRTRDRVKPVFVSLGHRITLREAMALTLGTTTRYRLPEPTRLAHLLSKNTTAEAP